MRILSDALNRVGAFLNTGIAGSEFTPLRLLLVITLISGLVWVTRRSTRWFVNRVLARRGFDVGMREAVGAIVRYATITLGVLVILQSAGIDLTSLHVLVGAIGVGLGFGLQNITNNFQLQVWTKTPLNSAGRLKSDLNFEIWRQLRAAGVAMPQPVVTLALPTMAGSSAERRTG